MAIYLEALTPEAEASLGGRSRYEVPGLPFRVGRESRLVPSAAGFKVMERRRADVSPTNDLYLIDTGRRLNVSRAHFQIEADGADDFLLRDRGSALGTYVGEACIGGRDLGGVGRLRSGDLIVVGTTESPFVFRFVVDR
jgi:pSer/pThr/pTyr-binding forkhead associated (FHA) protein